MSAEKFFALFTGNNSARHYIHCEDGTDKGWYRTEERGITLTDVQRHLRGEEPSLLSVPILPTGNCHFADGDVDCHSEGDTPVDHAVLAKKITELRLPLIVTQSRRGGGAHLTLFFKEPEGCPAPDARRLIAHYLAILGLKGEIFPKQSDGPEKLGSGINLPYFGTKRVAFGENGEQLDLAGFLALAEKRRLYGSLLIRDLPHDRANVKEVSGAAASDEQRPMSKLTARKINETNFEALRNAEQGEGNARLNQTMFFAGKCFAAGVFDETVTEKSLKQQALDIVLHQWNKPHPESAARETVRSGWTSGFAQPLTINDLKQIIWTSSELTHAITIAENILHEIGGKFYESNRRLVIPCRGRDVNYQCTEETDGIKRDETSVIINDASLETVEADLADHAQFVVPHRTSKGAIAYQNIMPPQKIYSHLLNRIRQRVDGVSVPYPYLDLVVNTPVLLPNGTVHDAPGEYRAGVLFVATSRKFPRVEVAPSQDDAKTALAKFDSVFHGFPFVSHDDAEKLEWNRTPSYSVVLASILSLAAQPALSVFPIVSGLAPKQRSGKTKVIEAAVAAAIGYQPTTVAYTDETEFGKALVPLLLHRDRAILIDNITHPLRSAKLALIVTGIRYTDRILGESRDVDLENRSIFFVTGNNLAIVGDLAVRALQFKIDPAMERPEERRFEFDPVDRATERHPELVAAALTALRAYIITGKPWNLKRAPWGGFIEWDRLISGCLTWLGYADPYLTRAAVIEDDPERETNVSLLQAWFKDFGSESTTLVKIRDNPQFETHRLLSGKNGFESRLAGYRLRMMKDRIEGGLKLITGTGLGGKKSHYWRVVSVADASGPGPSGDDQKEIDF